MPPHNHLEYLYKHLNENGQWVSADGEPVTSVNTADATPGQNKYDPDYWEKRTKSVDDFKTYRTDIYLGGPLPLLGKGNSFFLSGDAMDTRTYLAWTEQPFQKESQIHLFEDL